MNKKEQVIKVLLTPINVTGYSGKDGVSIKKTENCIETTQTYYPYKSYDINIDPDMSDFAIGFYEIIYRDILDFPMLNSSDTLSDVEFAGDTMNTFNTIANRVPGAGKSRKCRTPISEWPEYLQRYYFQYHCLANFWILPMIVGRKIDNKYCKGYYDKFASDGGIQDYMDRFIQKLEGSFDKYKESYVGYFNKIPSLDAFFTSHILNGSYVNNGEVLSFSNYEPIKFVSSATDMIEKRANAIGNSKYMDELWEYFNSYGLFD